MYGVVLYGVVLYGVVLYGVVLYGVVLYGVVLYGVVLYTVYSILYSEQLHAVQSLVHIRTVREQLSDMWDTGSNVFPRFGVVGFEPSSNRTPEKRDLWIHSKKL